MSTPLIFSLSECAFFPTSHLNLAPVPFFIYLRLTLRSLVPLPYDSTSDFDFAPFAAQSNLLQSLDLNVTTYRIYAAITPLFPLSQFKHPSSHSRLKLEPVPLTCLFGYYSVGSFTSLFIFRAEQTNSLC